MPITTKKIRNGRADKLQKVTVVLGIVTIVLGLIPVAQMLITKGAVKQISMFPLAMALIVLYSINAIKKKN
jgi:hypothetical protein